MHNGNKPNLDELPTSAQLIKSTIIAAVAAVVILVTIVLPSEYGIDPTGIGKAVGLAEMGEIKVQLAEEAEADRLLEIQNTGTVEEQSSLGGGFFSSTVRPAKASNGARPTMCRILLLLDTGATGAESNDEGGRVLLRSAVQGRTGPILADDPWMGTTTNTSLARSDGWAAAKLADEEDIPLGQLVPVPMPAATKRGNLQAGKTKRLFDFPQLV